MTRVIERKRREMADLLVLLRPSESLQDGAIFSGKTYGNHIGLAGKERVTSVPQRKQLASTPELPFPKGKGTEPSVQITKS